MGGTSYILLFGRRAGLKMIGGSKLVRAAVVNQSIKRAIDQSTRLGSCGESKFMSAAVGGCRLHAYTMHASCTHVTTTCTRARVHLHTCNCIHTYAYVHMHAHTPVHIHACAYNRTYTCTCAWAWTLRAGSVPPTCFGPQGTLADVLDVSFKQRAEGRGVI